MIMTSSRPLRPGDKLKSIVWSQALTHDGRLVMPTIDRLNVVREMVVRWVAEDQQMGPDESREG